MLSRVADPSRTWLAHPDLYDPLTRIVRGEANPGDLARLTEAAPPAVRNLVPLLVQVLRAKYILLVARARAAETAKALLQQACASRDMDRRAADAALQMISRYGLLDEPAEPRLVGCPVEHGLEIDPGREVILAHCVTRTRTCDALFALVADRDQLPDPQPDREQIARVLANGLIEQGSR